MTSATIQPVPGVATHAIMLNDRYVRFLACALLGYAVMGKGFAYMGVPPLFIGEVVLVLGLVVLMRTGCLFATLASLTSLLAVALGLWAVMRTLPYVRQYGIDALRDSVIVTYGCFAFITAALLIERPDRINEVVRYFRRFTAIYVHSAFFVYYGQKLSQGHIPTWPTTGVPINLVRPGEVAVHLCAASVFSLLGFYKIKRLGVVLLVLGVGLVSAQSRGGMLAILVPVTFAAIIAGRVRQFIPALLIIGSLGVVAYTLDLNIQLSRDERSVRIEQLVANVGSIFGSGDNAGLDGTKMWRLRWWEAIRKYTLHGDYFWTGKGFGINLAEDDGFVVGQEGGGAILRSPHNGHMTILARTGVSGLVLWGLFLASVFLTLLRHMILARWNGAPQWSNLFLFLLCYIAAIIIDASFDVALEGPMLGIWFWVLVGLSIGSSMIYRASLAAGRRAGHALAADLD